MSSPEYKSKIILEDTLAEIADEASTPDLKDDLDAINAAISQIVNLKEMIEGEIQQAAESVATILNALAGIPTSGVIGVGPGSVSPFDLDYDSIRAPANTNALRDPLGEFYLEFVSLGFESFFLGQGIDKIKENVSGQSYTREFIYESITDEIREARQEYIAELNKLPQIALTLYPNPVAKGAPLTIEINPSLIQQGIDIYAGLIFPYLEFGNSVGITFAQVREITGNLGFDYGLPKIDLGGFDLAGVDLTEVSTLSELQEAFIADEDNVRVQGTLQIFTINGKSANSPVKYDLDQQGNINLELSTSTLAPGVYFLEASDGERVELFKFVVQ